MIIAQISDTHLAGRGKKTYGIAPMGDNLSKCVEHINQFNPAPDLVLVTGDITCSGKPEEYDLAASLLNKLHAPYFIIPGNHDNKMNLLSTFSETAYDYVEGFINYVINDYDIRLIAMDTTIRNKHGGEVCEERANWLNDRLAEDKSKPTIIFMHHPPVKLSIRESNFDGFIGAERLGEVIENYSNIERILCGHVHLPTFVQWHGTIVSTAPSIGMQLVLDLTLEKPSEFILEEPAYQLHHWTPQKNLVTHTITVSENNKSYLFEESENKRKLKL